METGQTGTQKTSTLNFWVCDLSSSSLCLLLQLETHGVQRFLTIMLSICCLYAVWFGGGTHPVDLGKSLEHNCCDTLSPTSLLGFEWFCFHKTLSTPNHSSRMRDAHGNAAMPRHNASKSRLRNPSLDFEDMLPNTDF